MAVPAVSGLSRQVRCFSTSVVRPFAKLVRPPVQVYGIEGRYATALYSAASKQNKLEQVEKELLRPLDETTLSELKTVLKSFLGKGQVLKVEVKKYVDMSAKTKIQKLSRALREVI
ncbi:hypothetical protein MC885_018221 [Smutsia gigantea]|nr:hypothetical protein MC885_018221 [Smutsia gigantea]